MLGTRKAIFDMCIEVGECWEWQGACDSGGKPVMRLKGSRKLIAVRRHILLRRGIDMTGLAATNTCNNPKCVCPAHAVAWTMKELITRAAITTGYARRPDRNAAISKARRDASPITPEMVAEIRNSPESGHAIARRLGHSQSTIHAIRAHETWKDYGSPYLQLGARPGC